MRRRWHHCAQIYCTASSDGQDGGFAMPWRTPPPSEVDTPPSEVDDDARTGEDSDAHACVLYRCDSEDRGCGGRVV